MKRLGQTLAIAVLFLVSGSAIAGVILHDATDPRGATPNPHDADSSGGGAIGGVALPYGPVVVDNTSVLFNLTNHSGENQTISVGLTRTDAITSFARVEANLRHGDTSSWSSLHFLDRTGIQDRGLMAVQHDDRSYFEGPVSLWGFLSENTPMYDYPTYDETAEVEIAPGPHHLFVSVQNTDMMLEVDSFAGQAITINVAEDDPDMYRVGYAHVEGHWDEVALEAWGTVTGAVQASTQLETRNQDAWLFVAAFGEYTELKVMDSHGNECAGSTLGSTMATDPLFSAVSFYASEPGDLTIEAFTMAAPPSAPFLVYFLKDYPLPRSPPFTCNTT